MYILFTCSFQLLVSPKRGQYTIALSALPSVQSKGLPMTTLSSFLARRYLATRDIPRSMRIIIRLCYAGIAIGAASLMLALMITRGFEREIGKKLQGVNAQAVISAPGNQLEIEPLREHVRNWFGPFIKGMSGSSTRHILLEHNKQHHVLFMRGMNAIDEGKTTQLLSKLVAPAKTSFADLTAQPKTVVLGSELALQQRIKIGDTITVQVPEPSGSRLALCKHELTVGGIFKLGLDEYDSHAAFCSLETLEGLYEEKFAGVDRISVSFTQPSYKNLPWWQRLVMQLRDWWQGEDGTRLRYLHALKYVLSGLSVRGWEELYPDLAASLALEKYAITIVLALIALVASMLMICLLFMLLQFKRRDIAILRAMGASRDDIHSLFHRIGLTIAFRSVTAGLLFAGAVGWWLQTYKMITLPDVYYLPYLPASLEPSGFIIIFLVTMLLAHLACRVPLRQLRSLDITEIFRS
jgi:ABC-type lipoprotein release transport system permease subunit